jgi:ribosomal protein S18 acetylase RimI-like enzyme
MNVPEIIRAYPKDLERVKSVLKLGFASDALVRWVFPDPANYLKSFDIWMQEFSKIAYEHDVVYSEKNFAGASIWHPPSAEFDETVLESTFDAIPEERLETIAKFFEEFNTYHPDDSWYLAFIAVDPSQQRKGIGSFLLREALQMIDQRGERVYLEATSEQNKALYERHGFIEMGKVQFKDSPSAFPMIREAR